MKKTVLFLMVVFAVALAGCSSKEVASVNGKKITEADFENEIASLPSQYQMMASDPSMRRMILDNMVISELLMQRAEKEGLLKDPQVASAIKSKEMEIKSEAKQGMESLKRQLESSGRIAKREIVIKEMFEGRDFLDVAVADESIKDSYNRYSENTKRQNPNAAIEPFEKVKDEIRLSLARQKWVESLREEAKIDINEEVFLKKNPMEMMQQGGGIQIEAPGAGENRE